MRYIIVAFLFSCICIFPVYAQKSDNIYSVHSYRRGETASKYKYNKQLRKECKDLLQAGKIEEAKEKLNEYFAGKIFAPTYNELKSSEKGVSLSDWRFHMLPQTMFESLNTDQSTDDADDKYLSKEEFDAHVTMGDVKLETQNRSSVIKVLKDNKVDNYKERLKNLNERGYDLADEKYYVDPENDATVATKTYVNIKNGEIIIKQVPLDKYVMMLINDEDDENPVTFYMIGLIMLALSAVSIFVISKFM